MEFVLGLDLGTSYFKAGLFDQEGNLLGLGRSAVLVEDYSSLCCELPLNRFWSLVSGVVDESMRQAQATPEQIQGLSYSSQANSFLLLDRKGQPLTPLILWPDDRSRGDIHPAIQCLSDRKDFLERIGHDQFGSIFAIAKLGWFRKHNPRLWARVGRFMTISDYLSFVLTGDYVGDQATGALLGMWDQTESRWWPDALDSVDLKPSQVSTLVGPGTGCGRLCSQGASRLGLKTGAAYAVGTLDHHAASVGAGVGPHAQACESTGTVLAALRQMQDYSPQASCCVGPNTESRGYYKLVFDNCGASALEWFQRTYAPQVSIESLIEQARQSPADCSGLRVRLSDQPERPVAFENLSREHSLEQQVRAILQAVSSRTKALIEFIFQDSAPDAVLATGGGARSDFWVQLKADMLGVPFIVPACCEPAVLGAAMFAAATVGWYSSVEEASQMILKPKRLFTPDPAAKRVYDQLLKGE